MKRLSTLITALFLSAAATFAQAPQGFSYQAVVRDAQDSIVANQTFGITLAILQGATADAAHAVYTENHTVTTNQNGLFTLAVGEGQSANDFSAIDWSKGTFYLKTESPYGTSVAQLLSVPFAMYAAKAASADIDLSAYAKKSEIPAAPDLSDYALKSDIPIIPNIPTKTSDLENDSHFLTTHQSLEGYARTAEVDSIYAKKTEIPAAPDLSNYALKSEIPIVPSISTVPTKISAFENDANYLTEHQDISGKQDAITDLAEIRAGAALGATALQEHQPLTAYAKTADIEAVYAKKSDIPTATNLEGYAQTADIEATYATKTALAAKADTSALANYATKEALQTVDNKFSNYATTTAMNAKADAADLANYATPEALQTIDNKFINYATTTALNAQADTTALANYATTAALQTVDNKFANYATTEAMNAKADAADLANYATLAALQTVDNKFANYATTEALSAKADASALANYATTEDLQTVDNKFANYAIKTDLDAKANKNEMTVTRGTGSNADKSTIQLQSGTSATVLIKHQSLDNYYSAYQFDTKLKNLYIQFETLKAKTIKGALNGVFSVANDKRVCFSQGNLQFQASTSTWRFAKNQWDYIGSTNSNASSSYTGWIDLFGWGTSGYDGKNPYATSKTYSDYANANADIAGTNYDWGVQNAISNGGNVAGQWRTLTKSEWDYLLNSRSTNSGQRFAMAKVCGVNGFVLLPDNWNTDTYNFAKPNNNYADFESNTISADDWYFIEIAGAVFLPAAGYRNGTAMSNVGNRGCYWTATKDGSSSAYYLYFNYATLLYPGLRYEGNSVRLVCDLSD